MVRQIKEFSDSLSASVPKMLNNIFFFKVVVVCSFWVACVITCNGSPLHLTDRKCVWSKIYGMSCVPYNKLLTNLACSSRTGEYWLSVIFVWTKHREVRTVTTSGQYCPVWPLHLVSKGLLLTKLLWSRWLDCSFLMSLGTLTLSQSINMHKSNLANKPPILTKKAWSTTHMPGPLGSLGKTKTNKNITVIENIGWQMF